MTRVVVGCGCSAMIEVMEVQDGRDTFTLREVPALCGHCVASGGDYAASPAWREDPPRGMQARAAPRKRGR